jgi:protein gp37
MAETKIGWTAWPRPDGTRAPGYTFNAWWGCEKVSEACTHCYAETWAKRTGHDVWGGKSPRRFFGESQWAQLRKWDQEAEKLRERRRVFSFSMGDVFEDREDLVAPRMRFFALVEQTSNLDHLILTKRPENAARMVPPAWLAGAWPANVWMGTTFEHPRHDQRLADLDGLPAPRRFVSVEPMIEDVTDALEPYLLSANPHATGLYDDPLASALLNQAIREDAAEAERAIGWVIVGGESGGGARPLDLRAVRRLHNVCRRARVPFYMKQFGAWPSTAPSPDLLRDRSYVLKLKDRKGETPAEWPADLQVQELPESI